MIKTEKIAKYAIKMDKEELTVEQEKKLEEFKRIFFNKFGLYLKFDVLRKDPTLYTFTEDINLYKSLYLILTYTETKYNVITGPGRKQDLVLIRGVIAYILYNNGMSINKISRGLNRDHSTIIKLLRTFSIDVDNDRYTKKFLKEVFSNLKRRYIKCEINNEEEMFKALKEFDDFVG